MRYIGIDTETWLITDANPVPKGVCASVYEEEKEPELFTIKEFEPTLEFLLKEDDITLVAHNASFDFKVLAYSYSQEIFELINRKYKKGLIICTYLHEKLIRLGTDGELVRGEFSLAFCAEKYLGLDLSGVKQEGSWRMRFCELDGKAISEYPRDAADYAKEDAKICLEVFESQIGEHLFVEDVKIQGYVDWLCNILSSMPLEVDKEFLEERLTHFTDIIKKADVILVKTGLKERKFKTKEPELLKKNKKVIQAIIQKEYEKREWEVPVTDKGGIKTGVEFLEPLKGVHEGLDALLSLGQSEKCVTTYLKPWKESIHGVMPKYDVLVRSGRMSSFGPNIQNVPREGNIRGCIVPKEGFVFCSIDYSQLELCTLGQVIKILLPHIEPHLLNAINSGKDVHCFTGSNILKISYDEMIEGKKNENVQCINTRQMAKAANFGLPGGLGKKTFIDYAKNGYGVVISEDEVKNVFDSFFSTFPDVRAYLDFIPDLIKHDKYITFYECKQLFTDRVRNVSQSNYCSACNTFFQGLAGDGIKRAIIETFNACWFYEKSLVYGCEPAMVIHDEIIFQIPEDENMSEKAKMLAGIMEDTMSKLLVDVTNIEAEPALMRRWDKKAKPVYNDNGDLLIWEDSNG